MGKGVAKLAHRSRSRHCLAPCFERYGGAKKLKIILHKRPRREPRSFFHDSTKGENLLDISAIRELCTVIAGQINQEALGNHSAKSRLFKAAVKIS